MTRDDIPRERLRTARCLPTRNFPARPNYASRSAEPDLPSLHFLKADGIASSATPSFWKIDVAASTRFFEPLTYNGSQSWKETRNSGKEELCSKYWSRIASLDLMKMESKYLNKYNVEILKCLFRQMTDL